MEQQSQGGSALPAMSSGAVLSTQDPMQGSGMSWGWNLFFGTVLTIMGFVALGSPIIMSVSAALVMGWFVLFFGIAQLIVAFFGGNRQENMAIQAVLGVIYILFGIVLVNATLFGSLVQITAFLGIYFLIDGIFRAVLAFQMRKEGVFGWMLVGALVSILFAYLILANILVASVVLIGILIGVQLTIGGMGLLVEGFAQRKALALESGESGSKNILLLVVILTILTIAFLRAF